VLDASPGVAFDDIVGLTEAKQALREAIILPAMRPGISHIYMYLSYLYSSVCVHVYICIFIYVYHQALREAMILPAMRPNITHIYMYL